MFETKEEEVYFAPGGRKGNQVRKNLLKVRLQYIPETNYESNTESKETTPVPSPREFVTPTNQDSATSTESNFETWTRDATPQPLDESFAIRQFTQGISRVASYNSNTLMFERKPQHIPAIWLSKEAKSEDFAQLAENLVSLINVYHIERDLAEVSPGLRVLVAALVLVDRFSSKSIPLTRATAPKALIAAFIVTSKLAFECHPTMQEYANISDVARDELLTLEIEFCQALDWKLFIPNAQLQGCVRRAAQLASSLQTEF